MFSMFFLHYTRDREKSTITPYIRAILQQKNMEKVEPGDQA